MKTKLAREPKRPGGAPRRRRHLVLAFALAALALLAIPAMSAAAQTRQVGGPGAADSGDCVGAPCATIGYAIAQAAPGDVIDVAPGNYEEQLTIAKPLTLQGDVAGGTSIGPAAGGGIVAGSDITLAAGAGGTVLRDLEVNSRAQFQPAIATEGGAIDNVTIERVEQQGIGPSTLPTTVSPGLEISVPAAHWQVLDSSFEGDYQGILVSADATDMTIAGSSFNRDRNGLYVARSTPLGPASTGTIEGLSLRDSEFVEDEYRGLYFEGLSEATIEGITVTGTGRGMATLPSGAAGLAINLKAGEFRHIAIRDSAFSGSTNEGIAIQVRGYPGDTSYEGPGAAKLESVEVGGATITGNGGPGIAITNWPNLAAATVVDSRIVGNGLADLIHPGTPAAADGIFALNEEPGAPRVEARDNWFGCNAGPSVLVASCDGVDAAVEAAPWLVLTAAAEASSLAPNAATGVRAAIDTNSAGAPGGTAPNGTPVSFAAGPGGTVSPAATALLGGVAGATYVGTVPGDAHLAATVDGQSVAVPLSVQAPPGATAAPGPAPVSAAPSSPPPAELAAAPPITIEKTESKTPKVVAPGGNVTVATVGCASSSCEVEAARPAIKIGGRSFKVKVMVPETIAGGGSAPIRVVLPRQAREALAAKGKGTVRVKVTVTAADGTSKTIALALVVRAKPARQHGKQRG